MCTMKLTEEQLGLLLSGATHVTPQVQLQAELVSVQSSPKYPDITEVLDLVQDSLFPLHWDSGTRVG